MYDPDPYHDKARAHDIDEDEEYNEDEDFDEDEDEENDEEDETPWSELEKRLALLVGYRRYQDPDEDELTRYHQQRTELVYELAKKLFELDTGASIFDVRQWEGIDDIFSDKFFNNEWAKHLDEIGEALQITDKS